MAVEREVKLGAAPGFHLPALDGVLEGVTADAADEKRLETVYHDTPDLRLARWGVSLRHRAGEGWTVKLPGSEEAPFSAEHGIPIGVPSGFVINIGGVSNE